MVLYQSHIFQGAINNSAFDFIIYSEGGTCKLKNMATDSIVYTSKSASDALNHALGGGNRVCFQKGNYTLTGNVYVTNKINAQIVGNDAQINGGGYKIIIRGDDYTFSKYNSISGFTIIDATLRVENSFMTSISNMVVAYAFGLLGFLISAFFIHAVYFRNFWVLAGIALAIPRMAEIEIESAEKLID